MGREVRMVPPDWQHPTKWQKDFRTGNPVFQHVPLIGGSFSRILAEWEEQNAQWEKGFQRDYKTDQWKTKDTDYAAMLFSEYSGKRPLVSEYMPEFAPGTATHFMMYEDTSEGTPISPAFATPEELAHWLADNNASAFAGDGATYEQWLRVCRGGYAPSMIMTGIVLQSGVAGLADEPCGEGRK